MSARGVSWGRALRFSSLLAWGGAAGPCAGGVCCFDGCRLLSRGRSVDTPQLRVSVAFSPPADYGLLLSVSFTALLVGVKWCLVVGFGLVLCIFWPCHTERGLPAPQAGGRAACVGSPVAAPGPGGPLAAVSVGFFLRERGASLPAPVGRLCVRFGKLAVCVLHPL